MVHQLLSLTLSALPLRILVFWRCKNNFSLKYSSQTKLLHYIIITFFLLFTRHTERSPETNLICPVTELLSCLISIVSKGFFLHPCDPHSLYIYYLYYSSILRIYPEDWKWGSDLFKVTLVPKLRITLCYQESLFTLPATFYRLTYISHT